MQAALCWDVHWNFLSITVELSYIPLHYIWCGMLMLLLLEEYRTFQDRNKESWKITYMIYLVLFCSFDYTPLLLYMFSSLNLIHCALLLRYLLSSHIVLLCNEFVEDISSMSTVLLAPVNWLNLGLTDPAQIRKDKKALRQGAPPRTQEQRWQEVAGVAGSHPHHRDAGTASLQLS